MKGEIAEFFDSVSIAVVGVSSSRMKFGSMAYRALKSKGYQVHAVNRRLNSFDGDACYASLTDIPGEVEAAVVTVKPESAVDVLDEADKAGVKKLWFQEGGDFAAVAQQARSKGFLVVTDKCVLLYAEPVSGIHRVHRFFAKLFNRY